MKDQYQREINYLRISLTSDCNLRCRYCMPPGAVHSCLPRMSDSEIIQIVTIMSRLGIRCVKLTGGEPLLRPSCAALAAKIKQIPGMERVTLTTNGMLLRQQLPALLDAGLDAVNISLDAMEPALFSQITGGGKLSAVLEAVDAAVSAGLQTKINTVLMRGVNENQWENILFLAKDSPVDVRFIEMMPIGRGKQFDSVRSQEILVRMRASGLKVTLDSRIHGFGPAKYYQIQGYQGSVGLISAIHGKFCSSCNRVRLTSDGWLRPCLCYDSGVDVCSLGNVPPEEAENRLREIIYRKPKEHCLESQYHNSTLDGMYVIGG